MTPDQVQREIARIHRTIRLLNEQMEDLMHEKMLIQGECPHVWGQVPTFGPTAELCEYCGKIKAATPEL